MSTNTTSNTNNENKVPTFDGNRTNFEVFWPKFQAYAKSKGFSSVIKRDGPDPKLPASLYEADGTTRRNLSADEKKAYEKNSKAILALTNAFSTVTLLRVISKTIDNAIGYEEGKAHDVVKAIMQKYRPDDTVGGLDALCELDALKLDDDMDPSDLFEKIDNLKAVYGDEVLDDNIVIKHIMTTAPPVYLNNLSKTVVEKGRQLKLDDLKTMMEGQYRFLKSRALQKGEDERETRHVALAMADDKSDPYNQMFKKAITIGGPEGVKQLIDQVCYLCGSLNHRANSCPIALNHKSIDQRHNGNQRRYGSRKPCGICGRQGHRDQDCWELEKNAHKRPANWVSVFKRDKSNDSIALIAIDGVNDLVCTEVVQDHPTDVVDDTLTDVAREAHADVAEHECNIEATNIRKHKKVQFKIPKSVRDEYERGHPDFDPIPKGYEVDLNDPVDMLRFMNKNDPDNEILLALAMIERLKPKADELISLSSFDEVWSSCNIIQDVEVWNTRLNDLTAKKDLSKREYCCVDDPNEIVSVETISDYNSRLRNEYERRLLEEDCKPPAKLYFRKKPEANSKDDNTVKEITNSLKRVTFKTTDADVNKTQASCNMDVALMAVDENKDEVEETPITSGDDNDPLDDDVTDEYVIYPEESGIADVTTETTRSSSNDNGDVTVKVCANKRQIMSQPDTKHNYPECQSINDKYPTMINCTSSAVTPEEKKRRVDVKTDDTNQKGRSNDDMDQMKHSHEIDDETEEPTQLFIRTDELITQPFDDVDNHMVNHQSVDTVHDGDIKHDDNFIREIVELEMDLADLAENDLYEEEVQKTYDEHQRHTETLVRSTKQSESSTPQVITTNCEISFMMVNRHLNDDIDEVEHTAGTAIESSHYSLPSLTMRTDDLSSGDERSNAQLQSSFDLLNDIESFEKVEETQHSNRSEFEIFKYEDDIVIRNQLDPDYLTHTVQPRIDQTTPEMCLDIFQESLDMKKDCSEKALSSEAAVASECIGQKPTGYTTELHKKGTHESCSKVEQSTMLFPGVLYASNNGCKQVQSPHLVMNQDGPIQQVIEPPKMDNYVSDVDQLFKPKSEDIEGRCNLKKPGAVLRGRILEVTPQVTTTPNEQQTSGHAQGCPEANDVKNINTAGQNEEDGITNSGPEVIECSNNTLPVGTALVYQSVKCAFADIIDYLDSKSQMCGMLPNPLNQAHREYRHGLDTTQEFQLLRQEYRKMIDDELLVLNQRFKKKGGFRMCDINDVAILQTVTQLMNAPNKVLRSGGVLNTYHRYRKQLIRQETSNQRMIAESRCTSKTKGRCFNTNACNQNGYETFRFNKCVSPKPNQVSHWRNPKKMKGQKKLASKCQAFRITDDHPKYNNKYSHIRETVLTNDCCGTFGGRLSHNRQKCHSRRRIAHETALVCMGVSNEQNIDQGVCGNQVGKGRSNSDVVDTVNVAGTNNYSMKDMESMLIGAGIDLDGLERDESIWIGDTGASTHITFSNLGLVNTREIDAVMMVGDGNHVNVNVMGRVEGKLCNKDGNAICDITLDKVQYSPSSKFNLLSITTLLCKGWKLFADGKSMKLYKEDKIVNFDIIVKTPRGMLFAVQIKRKEKELCALNLEKYQGKTLDINVFHKYVRMSPTALKNLAKSLKIVLTGEYKIDPAWAAAVAKRNNLNKVATYQRPTRAFEQMNLDLSKIRCPDNLRTLVRVVPKSNWRLLVDQRCGMGFSTFVSTKDAMVHPTCVLLSRFKDMGHPVKVIRMDNAGENKLLEAETNGPKWKLNIDFEYTAANTPEQNSVVEKKFHILTDMGRAMMNGANLPEHLRYKLHHNVFSCATKIDNLRVIEIDGQEKTRYEHAGLPIPGFVRGLKAWGEAGVVKYMKGSKPKIHNKGVVMMFVDYADNHGSDCYRMYNPTTNSYSNNRDITWLNRMYYDVNKKPITLGVLSSELEALSNHIDNDISTVGSKSAGAAAMTGPRGIIQSQTQQPSISPNRQVTQTATAPKQTRTTHGNQTNLNVRRSARHITTPRALRLHNRKNVSNVCVDKETFDDHCVTRLTDAILEDSYDDNAMAKSTHREIAEEVLLIGAGVGGGFGNTNELKPMKFQQAMNTKDKEGWIKAVEEEWNKMKEYNVFEKIPRKDLPKGTKILTTTWAMKKKASGVLRARINARGFEQVNGIHYDSTEASSPVTHDITIRVCLILMLMMQGSAGLLDIKGAFLHGRFEDEEPIYIEVPEGFEKHADPQKYVFKLKRTLYGLKQSSRMFWKELLKAMQFMGFSRCESDPCLYYKWTESGLIVWLSWVDDCLCIGPTEEVMKAKVELKQLFECDDILEFNEYVGCKIDHDKEKGTLKFTQPVLIQSYVDEFNLPNYNYNTPGAAGEVLSKPEEGMELDKKTQQTFQSGVGKLLHMMRFSRPEIWNSVREVSRRMSSACPAHMKAMLRIMQYCVTNPSRGWTLKPSRFWDGKDRMFEFKITAKSDSNYATCKDTRKSVTGYVIYLEDALVAVKSGMQRIVALSVTEAELIALVQCLQEMIFIAKMISSMGLRVAYPLKICVDNKGTMDLINGYSIGGGTKHCEVRIAYIRQLREEGKITVEWISTDDNEADIYTKNVTNQVFEKHCKHICCEHENE